MTRELLKQSETLHDWVKSSFQSAVFKCMQIDELVDFVENNYENANVRNNIFFMLQKVDKASAADFDGLIESLLIKFDYADPKEQIAIAKNLFQVFHLLSASGSMAIQEKLLSSKYVGIRRIGLKTFAYRSYVNNGDVSEALESALNAEIAKYLSKHASAEFCTEHFDYLDNVLVEAEDKIHLYLKIGEQDIELVERLRDFSPARYFYVKAKLKSKISPEIAEQLIRLSTHSADEMSLIIWALGELHDTVSLQYIAMSAESINADIDNAMRKMSAIPQL